MPIFKAIGKIVEIGGANGGTVELVMSEGLMKKQPIIISGSTFWDKVVTKLSGHKPIRVGREHTAEEKKIDELHNIRGRTVEIIIR